MIWYFDSGASRHITSRKDLFSSLDAAPAGKKVTCANNASYPIKGVGKILITISDGSDLCLPNVLYVPGIKKNLLSVSSLAKNGLRVIFEDDRCIVRDRENGYSLITTGTLENGLFVLDRYEKQIQACIVETKTQAMQDAELWHARFGHVGYGSLMTLQRHNMVHDLSLLEMPPRHVCEGCVLGKMHRFAFSQDGSVRATRKLQLVHSDVCGPMRTPSVGNSLYFVTFIDDFSRFCWVYPLKAKSDVFAVFQHYVSMVENETGCKVQTLRTDRGGEYMSGAFKDFLGKKGIKHQCTMPYTPQQNGVAERKNRSLMEMARCMLKAKSLPHKLWMEAVACAAHVLNRCPTRALKTITPYESWYDRKPSVSYLRVFGCLAYAHIPQQLRGKLDDKAVKCIFVGYSSGSKGYRLYNPATNKIFESRDVIFAETTAQPMVAFDVSHMQTQDVFEGFLPSFVENQESQQVDNFDQSFDQHVTPHDVEEIVREEQEVLREERTLPKWVQKTLQDSKLDAPLPRKTQQAHLLQSAPHRHLEVEGGLPDPDNVINFALNFPSLQLTASVITQLKMRDYERVARIGSRFNGIARNVRLLTQWSFTDGLIWVENLHAQVHSMVGAYSLYAPAVGAADAKLQELVAAMDVDGRAIEVMVEGFEEDPSRPMELVELTSKKRGRLIGEPMIGFYERKQAIGEAPSSGTRWRTLTTWPAMCSASCSNGAPFPF
ncbi:hypothetical protein L7F22_018110 [Adiantum nelumboides]|nr:hypothetical protein [Adiantum nelumboides]